jgi:hypothetical protein
MGVVEGVLETSAENCFFVGTINMEASLFWNTTPTLVFEKMPNLLRFINPSAIRID